MIKFNALLFSLQHFFLDVYTLTSFFEFTNIKNVIKYLLKSSLAII